MRLIQQIRKEMPALKTAQIEAVLTLLADGNTIPFIARYRKEKTGDLDEVAIKAIADLHADLMELASRKETVLKAIENQGKLSPALKEAIAAADNLQLLEDLYRPYRQKRKTKAQQAREKGLEPLALALLNFEKDFVFEQEGLAYLDPEKDLNDLADVAAGVHEILAEIIGDRADFRQFIRSNAFKDAVLESKLKDESLDPRQTYQIYYDFSSSIKNLSSHQVMAINRGEKEDILRVTLNFDDDKNFAYLEKDLMKSSDQNHGAWIQAAYEDAYRRFMKPAIEREIRADLTAKAEDQAIEVFGENLKNLLMQAPNKDKVILGFDPAFRSGCKLAVVDELGNLKETEIIYPHNSSEKQMQAAAARLVKMLEDHQVDLIAIGNGTASRESEIFVAQTLSDADMSLAYAIVDEAGASVYSASELARSEFPDLSLELRSAISIARRVQDPLAELVKIDPKSVGVGQYQHDISPKKLDEKLAFVVEMVVNQLGVDVNTASPSLLMHVSGLNKTSAQNLVDYRTQHGRFKNRQEIKKVKRFGPKTYQQAIGFLRIFDGDHPFDATGIHPESYDLAQAILQQNKLGLEDVGSAAIAEKIKKQSLLVPQSEKGKASLQDILKALSHKPEDLRASSSKINFRSDLLKIEDLKEGMEVEGTVRNVVDFGAFVDLGVGEDGLVHISQMSDRFIKHPSDLLAVGDRVKLKIISLDLKRNRIGLSMKK